MKNPAPYVKAKFFELLNGNVNYQSADVPVKEQGGKRVVPYMVLIGEFSLTDRSTKHSFSARASQLISVVHEGTGTLLHEHVDAIGDQVMDLIIPAPRTVLETDEFQITAIRKASQNYLDEPSGSGAFITRLLIRYDFLVNQLNIQVS